MDIDIDDLNNFLDDLNNFHIGQYYIFSVHAIGKVYGRLSEKSNVGGAIKFTLTDCIINKDTDISFSVKKPVVIYSTSVSDVEPITPEAEMLIHMLSTKLVDLDADTVTELVQHLQPDPTNHGMNAPEYEAINEDGEESSADPVDNDDYFNDFNDADFDDYNSDGSNHGGKKISRRIRKGVLSRNARSSRSIRRELCSLKGTLFPTGASAKGNCVSRLAKGSRTAKKTHKRKGKGKRTASSKKLIVM